MLKNRNSLCIIRVRIDFIAKTDQRSYAFECDGQKFHDFVRDELRDALLLGEGHVHTMYRILGSVINSPELEDMLLIIANIDGELFSERGMENLKRLTSERAQKTLTELPDSSQQLREKIRLRSVYKNLRSYFIIPAYA